jgi:hypothetical protein
MSANGLTRTELRELVDEVAEILEDEELSAADKIAEIEALVLGDEDEED